MDPHYTMVKCQMPTLMAEHRIRKAIRKSLTDFRGESKEKV